MNAAAMNGRLDVPDRRRRWGSISALVFAGASLGLSAVAFSRSSRGTIEVRRLVLTDAHGMGRAVLSVRDDGSAGLYLTDVRGTPRATLGVGADGVPALGLGDRDGMLRVALAVGADGAANLGFFDMQQNVRARLGIRPDAAPALDIFDDAQHDRVLLSVEPGRSLLRIADRSGQTRLGLGLSEGSPGIVIFDPRGGPISRLP
jgi:hypothetical protein